MAESKEKIVKDTLKFAPSNLILRFTQIIQGIFVANILGPTLYGVKNGIQLLLDYGQYFHLGSIGTFSRKRQLYEYSDLKQRDYYTNLVFSFLTLVSIIVILFGIICFFILPHSITIRLSILIIGFLIPTTIFSSFFITIIQSQNKFGVFSKNNILQGIFVLVFILIFVYLFGVVGYFLGALIGLLFTLIHLITNLDIKPKFIFDVSKLFLLIKDGFLLLLLTLNTLVFFSIDRFIIGYYYGATELGYYAIGLFFANLLFFFLVTLFIPITPKIYQNINKKEIVSKYIIKPFKYYIIFIYWILFMILLLFPFILFILPKYASGLVYTNILLFSVIFYPFVISNYYIGLNKEKFLLGYTSFFVILIIVLNLIVVLLNLNAIYIAIATLITFFAYGNILNLIGYKDLLGSYKLALKEIFNYLWPLGYALVGYGLLWLLAHYWLYGFLNYYIVKVIQAILFTIWYSPILWKIEKEHRILKMIWDSVKNKFKKEPIQNMKLE